MAPVPGNRDCRLLVLDCDPLVRGLVASVGERDGYQVRTTAEPSEFLAELRQWRPTHVALDPHASGRDMLGEMACGGCHAAVLVLSDQLAQLDAALRAAVERGLAICGVLAKPFGIEALRESLAAGRSAAADGPMPGARLRGIPFRPTTVDLREALAQRQFVVHYQPCVDANDGSVCGVEALARWQHPQHGMLMPGVFVEELERCGLVTRLTWRVLEQALPWLAEANLPASASLSVNVSVQDLAEPGLGERMVALCRAHGIDPGRIVLEIKEAAFAPGDARRRSDVARMRAHGFRVAIDDFGMDWALGERMPALPCDALKIDQPLVLAMHASDAARRAVEGIVKLGSALRLQVIAMAVESVVVGEALRALGCHQLQGYAIARPMDAQACQAWLRARGGVSPSAQGASASAGSR